MPCDSRVNNTTMHDHIKLSEALSALGWDIKNVSPLEVLVKRKSGQSAIFQRTTEKDAFFTGSNLDVNQVQKKYTELGVKQWAKSKGYSVVENDGQRMKLVNRRG